jgi:uncharacterized protein (TIGR01777 family)
MKTFVTGGTGLVGRPLIQRLIGRGDQVVLMSRRIEKARLDPALKGAEIIGGNPATTGDWMAAVSGCDAVVNLAGHGVFEERWSPEVKRKIRDSRVYTTQNLVKAIADAQARPATLVSASAIGYYGPTGDEEITEASPSGTDFLAVVAREWEDAAHGAVDLGARLAIVRVGVVLSGEGGALMFMKNVFERLPGGAAPIGSGSNPLKPGTGKQWVSWVHLDDIVGIFLMALDNAEARGPINGVSPDPVRNVDFARTLTRVIRRGPWPPFVPFGPPDALLRTVLGEVATVMVTGQRVIPARALELGFDFKHPKLEEALRDVLRR